MRNAYLWVTREIHPLSLILLVVLDLFWSGLEALVSATGIGIFLAALLIPVIFAACFFGVLLVQRSIHGDPWKPALIKGLIFGVIAAIPLSFISLFFAAVWGGAALLLGADREVILLGKLTKSWRRLENSLRRMAPETVRNSSLDVVIKELERQRKISPRTADQLHQLRRYRNLSTHAYTPRDLEQIVDQVAALNRRFDQRLRRRF